MATKLNEAKAARQRSKDNNEYAKKAFGIDTNDPLKGVPGIIFEGYSLEEYKVNRLVEKTQYEAVYNQLEKDSVKRSEYEEKIKALDVENKMIEKLQRSSN